jgi:hypothetical protein
MEIATFQVAINDLPKEGHCDRSSVPANPHQDFVAVGVTPELRDDDGWRRGSLGTFGDGECHGRPGVKKAPRAGSLNRWTS